MKLKYKKIIILITMSTMGIGLVTLSIGSTADKPKVKIEQQDNTKNADGTSDTLANADDTNIENTEGNTEIEPTSAETGNTVVATDTKSPEDSKTLQRDTYPEINSLIKKYYDARVACDIDAFKTLMNDSSSISLELLQKEAEYIEEYKNIECYTLPGPEEKSYVVYVYQEYKIVGIDTLAPGMKRFYVRTNEQGTPYIYIGAVDDEVKQVIDDTANNSDVKNLISSVEKKLQEAMTNDSDLNKFQKNLENEATSTADNNANKTEE